MWSLELNRCSMLNRALLWAVILFCPSWAGQNVPIRDRLDFRLTDVTKKKCCKIDVYYLINDNIMDSRTLLESRNAKNDTRKFMCSRIVNNVLIKVYSVSSPCSRISKWTPKQEKEMRDKRKSIVHHLECSQVANWNVCTSCLKHVCVKL